MILDVVKKRAKLERQLKNIGAAIVPKAIYVVETSNTVKGQEPRPIAIWRTLVKQGKVAAEEIAICTNTKEIPKEAVRVATIDQLSDAYPHIIFNKKLQEGWDDPSVYLCYFDGETGSGTRIQQVLGRAVRQPGRKAFQRRGPEHGVFLRQLPERAAGENYDQLKEELRIYKGDDPDFEPFEFKEERKALPKIPVKEAWTGKLKVPRLQLEMPPGETL